jgi:hypothetical protein
LDEALGGERELGLAEHSAWVEHSAEEHHSAASERF